MALALWLGGILVPSSRSALLGGHNQITEADSGWKA
jgi:hypothetical protein